MNRREIIIGATALPFSAIPAYGMAHTMPGADLKGQLSAGKSTDAAWEIALVIIGMIASLQKEEDVDPKLAFAELNNAYRDDVAREFAAVQPAGHDGILVPDDLTRHFVWQLNSTSAFVAGWPRFVPLLGEGYQIGDEILSVSFGRLQAIVPASLVGVPGCGPQSFSAAHLVADMLQNVSRAIDAAAFKAIGHGVHHFDAPKETSPSLHQIEELAAAAEIAILNSGHRMTAQWVMSWRTLVFLMNIRDDRGRVVFPELWQHRPIWRGKQIQVLSGLDANTLSLITFGDVLFWIRDMTLRAKKQNASENGPEMALVEFDFSADFCLRYPKSAVIIDGVNWGK